MNVSTCLVFVAIFSTCYGCESIGAVDLINKVRYSQFVVSGEISKKVSSEDFVFTITCLYKDSGSNINKTITIKAGRL